MSLKLSKSTQRRQLIIGFILTLSGILYGIFWENLFNMIIQKSVVLRANTKLYETWKSPPIKLVLDFYLFNWTNPEDFHNVSVKPILQELGPYRFIEVPNKDNIVWHSHNASVSYLKRSRYYFDEDGSNGRLSDRIVTVNSLAAAAAAKAKKWSPMRRTLIDLALNVYGDDISLHTTADELLFTGLEDVLLDVLNVIPTTLSDIIVPFDKFGYLYSRNDTNFYGQFNVHTGADDIRTAGKIHSWNHKTTTKFFPPQCSKISGSAGEFQPPNLPQNGMVEYFAPDLCRSLHLEYGGSAEVVGVPGYRYFGGMYAVDNGTLWHENECYCNGECVPVGAINISSCWFDTPVFMSYPHFLHADPYYLDKVIGLSPHQDKHELYVIMEPSTGFVLDAAARFQINVLIEPLPYLSMFKEKRKIFFPLFWFEERATITSDLATNLYIMPYIFKIGYVLAGISLTAGILLLLWNPVRRYINQRLEQHIHINELREAHSDEQIKSLQDC